ALKLQEDALGPDDPDVAINVNNLGSALAALGSYEEAEQQIQRALALREQLYGPVHPLTAETMTNLGDLYRLQGKYDEAEPLFLRSLDVRRHELESDHPALALSHVGLARVELGRGRPSAAREHAERALEINEASDAEPSAVATARWTLAQALWFDRGQRARAVTLAEQARADRARQGDSTEAIDGWLADERVRDDVADR
nr:tetratricopeptide repeat protein [Deltaproteobacteria bacterium]